LRLRCPPSALYTFPARVSPRGLARRCLVAPGAPGGSPSLTGVVPRVSTRALNRSSSPLRLPISPPGPRGMVTAATAQADTCTVPRARAAATQARERAR
jgi:hypothetical protein